MNLFNRIFTIVSVLVLTVIGLGVLFLASGVVASWIGGLLATLDATQAAIRALVGLIILALAVLLLWLEVRRPGARTVEVARSSGGSIRVTTGHVEERIAEQVDALSGVISSRVHINAHDNAVVARLEIHAAPGIDLVAKGEEIAAVTRIAVQDQLGLKLFGKPQITIRPGKSKPVPMSPVKPSSVTNVDSTPSDKA